MAGLVPAIHAFLCSQDVDARHKAGHDVDGLARNNRDYGISRLTVTVLPISNDIKSSPTMNSPS